MCRPERSESNSSRWQDLGWMGLKTLGREKEKVRGSSIGNGVSASSSSSSRSRMKMWMIRATTSVLLWTCIVQLTALGDMWGPRVLKGWPSCFTHDSSAVRALDVDAHVLPSPRPVLLPPKSQYHRI